MRVFNNIYNIYYDKTIRYAGEGSNDRDHYRESVISQSPADTFKQKFDQPMTRVFVFAIIVINRWLNIHTNLSLDQFFHNNLFI